MRLLAYDFVLKHRAGRVHNNADGLSCARAAPSPYTPDPDMTAIDQAQFPTAPTLSCPYLLQAALYAYDAEPHIDGADSYPLFANELAAPVLFGPRQLLLDFVPCQKCSSTIAANSLTSLICNRCNYASHVRCLRLTSTPAMYWY